MKYKHLAAVAVLAGAGLFSSCQDKFAEINSDPSAINNPNIRFLFTQCESSFQPGDYRQWFYGFDFISTWTQTTVAGSGNTNKLNIMTTSGCGEQVNEVLRYANEIRYQIDKLPEAEKKKHEYIKYLCNPLLVYVGMQDADLYGDRQYSEAEMARYGGTLTPKYDKQQDLFNLWLSQLDETINYLADKKPVDVLGPQDFIYKGNLSKWAKLANSLKLRIAARLINIDRARAIKIVNDAAANPAGFIATLEDDFVYNKGKKDNNFDESPAINSGSKQLIDFMVANRDPRLFYVFQKNDYNSNIVQGFFDQKRALPSYVEANVDFEVVDGKKVFKGWKAPGEPWVRYYGVPCQIDASKDIKNAEYFDPNGELFCLYDAKGVKKSYSPIASKNAESIKGLLTYTFPDVPGVAPVQDKEQYGWYGLYFSSGETNLLLAEFKLLGANLPKSAQEYLSAGVELSVRGYNFVAGQNHIPYYDATYANDKFDKSIKLTDSQITDMLSHSVYQLTGDKMADLEKVYIQQYIHYLMLPADQFVTVRRSGVPMKNSSILARQSFDLGLGDAYIIPRRFPVSEPLDSDLLRDLTISAYKSQGFTYNGELWNAPSTLSKERIWSDVGSPEYGAGPKL